MNEKIELCGQQVAMCICRKPEGHVEQGDDIHACDPMDCGGSWRGTEADLQVVTFPIIGAMR